MKKHEDYALIDGAHIYYEVVGSGHSLVLIHGFSLDSRMWDDQFETFAEHYQVIRYDVRGFGKSDLPDGEISHTDDLQALLDLLGVTEAHVLGFSMGGWIAVEFALLHPELTSALVLADGTVLGYPLGEIDDFFTLVKTKAAESDVQAAKELWLDQPLFKPAFDRPSVAPRLQRIISDYSGWHFVNTYSYRPLDPPALQRLDEVSAPTLLIVGERHLLPFHTVADTLHQSVPGARKVILPDVGHMSNMENPDRFNRTVLAFLAEI